MLIELTGYDRPVRLAQVTTMRQADMSGTLTFEPVGAGTRMRWSWRVRPKGAYPLLAPVIARMGRHQEQTVWAGMKQQLEAPLSGPAAAVLQRGRNGAKGREPRWLDALEIEERGHEEAGNFRAGRGRGDRG
jgi:hypothetical protein